MTAMSQIDPPRAQTENARSSERFPVTYPVMFGGAPFVDEGLFTDLPPPVERSRAIALSSLTAMC